MCLNTEFVLYVLYDVFPSKVYCIYVYKTSILYYV